MMYGIRCYIHHTIEVMYSSLVGMHISHLRYYCDVVCQQYYTSQHVTLITVGCVIQQ